MSSIKKQFVSNISPLKKQCINCFNCCHWESCCLTGVSLRSGLERFPGPGKADHASGHSRSAIDGWGRPRELFIENSKAKISDILSKHNIACQWTRKAVMANISLWKVATVGDRPTVLKWERLCDLERWVILKWSYFLNKTALLFSKGSDGKPKIELTCVQHQVSWGKQEVLFSKFFLIINKILHEIEIWYNPFKQF